MSAKAILEEFVANIRKSGGTAVDVRISQLMWDDLRAELGRDDIQNFFGFAITIDPTLDESPPPEILLH